MQNQVIFLNIKVFLGFFFKEIVINIKDLFNYSLKS